MSLKLKLISCISAFVLVLGLLFVGVWAVNQGSVQMGGNVSFTATDVYAKASGSISGAGEGNKTLPTLIFDADNETPDVSGWTNLDLAFDAVGSPITMEIVVENLATDRSLTVNLKDNFSSSAGVLEKDVKNGDSDYTGTDVVLNASTGSGTSTTTFTITLSLSSKNNSLSDTAFGYTINLYDASYEFPAITGFTFTENNDGTATLTEYTGTDTEMVIPSSYSIKMVDGVKTYIEGNDYLVTTIGGAAFRDCSSLTSITIPEGVTTISFYAFYGCDGLTSITIPNSVTTIGSYAFSSCRRLTSVTISESVTTIDEGAFGECYELTSIDLSDCTSLTTIGSYAFWDCSRLTNITIPNSATTIGSYAFWGCSGLTSITLSSSLTTIGDTAFYGCESLTNITFNTPYDWEISSESSFSSIETTLTASQVQENALEYLLDTYVEYYWRAVV